MFKKNHKNVMSDVQTTEVKENKFSKLPTAEEAYAEFMKIKQSKADDYPVLTQKEIICEINKQIADGSTFADFFNKKITDKDKKALEEWGYKVEVSAYTSTSIIYIRISWNK